MGQPHLIRILRTELYLQRPISLINDHATNHTAINVHKYRRAEATQELLD